MRLLARRLLLSRDEKRKKEHFVVYQPNEFLAAGISSDLQLIWSPKGEVHVFLYRTPFSQKYPHKPIFIGIYSTLNCCFDYYVDESNSIYRSFCCYVSVSLCVLNMQFYSVILLNQS